MPAGDVKEKVGVKELRLAEGFVLPKRNDWRIGIVGFGLIAHYGHAPAYQKIGWPLAAVADPDPAARELAQKNFGVTKAYTGFEELISDPDVEVIDLCTQPGIRVEVVEAAAAAGKHIIIEKPLGCSVAECERMVEICEAAGIVCAVHQNYRWHPMCFYAQQLVQAGYVGQPYLVDIALFGNQDVHLKDHAFYAHCDDFLTLTWDNHFIDLFRYWTGREVQQVFARTGRMPGQHFHSDNLMAVISDFGDGLLGHVVHSELCRSDLVQFQCRIEGTEGSVVFDPQERLVFESAKLGKPARVLDLGGIQLPSSWCGSMGDFLAAIEDGREPQVSARRNLGTVRAVLAEVASARAGGEWVEAGE